MVDLIDVYRIKIEVENSDLDENGHVNNISYVKWMQEIALEHSAELGWPGSRYKEKNVVWVVRQHTIDYLNQAWLHDEVVAETWVSDMKKVSSIRRYRFTRVSDGAVLVNAWTKWGFISTETGRPVKILPEVDAVFRQICVPDEPQIH